MEKVKLQFEVDVEQIANDLLTKELYETTYAYSLQRQVKDEIKRQAVEQLKDEITKEAQLTDFVGKDFGKSYLKELARKTLEEALAEKASEYVKNWVDKNLQFAIERRLRDSFEATLLPRLNSLIANVLVVNSEAVDEQMEEMEQHLKDTADSAYENGQEAMYKEIRNKF